MAAIVRRLGVGLLVVAGALMANVGPAAACSLALVPVTVNGTEVDGSERAPLTVRPGDRVHLQGSGFYEIVPEAERPSTTTTTVEGGGVLADCPPTRPARAVYVQFHQDGQDHVTDLARVDGSSIDLEVVIPSTAVPGPSALLVTSAWPVALDVVARTTGTTTPDELPRTGGASSTAALGAAVLVAGGAALLVSARLRPPAT